MMDRTFKMAETNVFVSVRAWLEGYGWEVHGEVCGLGMKIIDLVAVKKGRSWPVAVECKLGWRWKLLKQAIVNQLLTPWSYAAAPTRCTPSVMATAKRAGIGLVHVAPDAVTVILKPRLTDMRAWNRAHYRNCLILDESTRTTIGGAAPQRHRRSTERPAAV